MVVIEAILGWLLADLFTGVFHWAEDSFGSETTPVLGQWLIAPNRLHHVNPLAFTEHGFLGRNQAAIVAAVVVGGLWTMLVGPSVFMIVFLTGSAIANEVHFYAHRPSLAPRVIRWAQSIGLCQSPKAHALHHRPPFTSNFCVLTDWLNPLLNKVLA
jgi:ubiquitin-conjugating enzyme E2 variant